MALAGFAYSCMVVSSFSRAQQKVLDMGYPNDMNTSTMISGINACLYFNKTQDSFHLLTAELHCYWFKDDAILKPRHFKFSLTFWRTIVCQCDGNVDLVHFFQPYFQL